ncbi:MAG: porin family protein [Candidatus Krumholzibacteriaceae bacterium]
MKMRRRDIRSNPVRSRRAAPALAVMLVVLLAGGGAAFANQLWIGFHGGPSVPNLSGGTNEISEGYTSRYGPYFGIFGDYMMSPFFSVRGEINYSSEGGKRNGMQPIPTNPALPPGTYYASFNNEAIIDYLEIPVLAKLDWGQTIRFFVDAGPYLGFLVRAKTVTEGTSSLYQSKTGPALPYPKQTFDAETNIRQDINSTNFGAAGGLGVEMPYGPGNLVFDAHFAYGFTNIQKYEVDGENNTGSLAFTVGYSYPFGGKR